MSKFTIKLIFNGATLLEGDIEKLHSGEDNWIKSFNFDVDRPGYIDLQIITGELDGDEKTQEEKAGKTDSC